MCRCWLHWFNLSLFLIEICFFQFFFVIIFFFFIEFLYFSFWILTKLYQFVFLFLSIFRLDITFLVG